MAETPLETVRRVWPGEWTELISGTRVPSLALPTVAHLGRSTPRTLIVAPDGSILSERALSKLRTGDRGADYTYALLKRWGAPGRRLDEPGADYVRRALADRNLFRRVRHPGCLAYGWRLDGAKLASSPYPKGEVLVRAA